MTLQPVILAGGPGTRLWPLSREQHPKPFLPLMGERSLLQETLGRLEGMDGLNAPVLVCNEAHRFLLANQLRESGVAALSVVVEPVSRNTAPALTLAALTISGLGRGSRSDPVMLVMPSDHVVRDVKSFRRALSAGEGLARNGYLVTYGVVPDAPSGRYGYIRRGDTLGEPMGGPEAGGYSGGTGADGGGPHAYDVSEFVEKPTREKASEYLESGEFLWNSGIFMMRASVWLSELERHRPDIARACRRAHADGHVDGVFFRPGATDFISCPSDSIDYAVMEKAADGDAKCAVVALDVGWSDIGGWSALWEERDRDEQGNVVQGDVYANDTRNSLLLAQHRLLATVGVDDVVVVETADAVLVAKKDRVEDVKEIVKRLDEEGRTEHEFHRTVDRPWGAYEVLDSGAGFQVKRLTVNPGAKLSMQMHHQRAEHWVVVNGTAKVTRGDEVFVLRENESAYVPVGVTHRLENPTGSPLEIIEVQSGPYLGEDDIVRFQDDYERLSET